MYILLPLNLMHFLSVPFWIRFHLVLKKVESIALSSRVKSSLMIIGEGSEPLFDKTRVASKILRNLTSMGRGLELERLNFPSL